MENVMGNGIANQNANGDGNQAIASEEVLSLSSDVQVAVQDSLPNGQKLSLEGVMAPNALDNLSPREMEVMVRIALGETNQEIADNLSPSISMKTVEAHRAHMFKKWGVRNAAQLVVLAIAKGRLRVKLK